MLSGLRFWLSPSRRRFMRRLAGPGLDKLKSRLRTISAPWAAAFLATLIDANADFLAYALSPGGPLAAHSASATPEQVEACLGSLLMYSANLFAREDFARDDSGLIPLLAQVLELEPKRLMLRRDSLRKTPRSEEWMLYSWLAKDLAAGAPAFDPELERSFGYQYLSYIGQYKGILERHLAAAH